MAHMCVCAMCNFASFFKLPRGSDFPLENLKCSMHSCKSNKAAKDIKRKCCYTKTLLQRTAPFHYVIRWFGSLPASAHRTSKETLKP